MTKCIRRNAPDGAHCYSTRSGSYLRVSDDGSVSCWCDGYWAVLPGCTEDELLAADGIIWLEGRGYRFLWVTVFVLVLGVACMVLLR